MDRTDILNSAEYMYKIDVDPSEMTNSIEDLLLEFIENYDIEDECAVYCVDCNDNTFWTSAPNDFILVDFNEEWQSYKDYDEYFHECLENISEDVPAPSYIVFCDSNTLYVLNATEFVNSAEEWHNVVEMESDGDVETAMEIIEPYTVSALIQDLDKCGEIIGDIFAAEYGEAISLTLVNPEEDDDLEESVTIDKIDSKFSTNDLDKSKLVGDLFDDPEEEENKRNFKRKLKKYGGAQPTQDQQGGGMGGGMFGESRSLFLDNNKVLRLFEYQYVKKEPQPMDIVEFQGEECQVQHVHPDGTMTLLYKGMTVDGVTKRQVKQVSWANLETPLQFGKFDKNGNPDFEKNPWDERTEKFHDLNKKDNLAKADIIVDGHKFNESYVYFKDYVDNNKYVRVINESTGEHELMPRENVVISPIQDIEEWPFAVIVIDQTEEDPLRKIRVNPVSYCNAKSDDEDVEVLMNPSNNTESSRLKKKFIRVLT